MVSHGLFAFGSGYSTLGVARQAEQQGPWTVTSTARQPERFAQVTSSERQVIHFDPGSKQLLTADGLKALQGASYVISSIPPITAALYDPVLRAQLQLLKQATSSAGCQIQALGYLSSTGVYGDWQGAWVDENSEPRTATARGLLRVEAEQAWSQLAEHLNLPLTIFRLGGIYGPRRSVLLNLQSQAEPRASAVRRGQQRFTSRCHVADIVQAVLADMHRRMSRQPQQQAAMSAQRGPNHQQQRQQEPLPQQWVDFVNVVDDEPAPRGDVEAFARQLLGLHTETGPGSDSSNSQDQQAATGKTAIQQTHYNDQQQERQDSELYISSRRKRQSEPLEEKRVQNDKLKSVLGVQLIAPTYREGLQLLHSGNIMPFAVEDLECLHGA